MMRNLTWLQPPILQGQPSGRTCLRKLSKSVQCTFTTSNFRWATKKPRSLQYPSKQYPSESPTQSVQPYKSLTNAYVEKLTTRASPTLLYEGPSQAFRRTGSYLISGFSLAWAIINFNYNYLHPVEGTPIFIPYIMAAACAGMTVAAGWSFLKPWRVIRTITAVPFSKGSGPRAVNLHLEYTSLVPGKRPVSLVVAPGDVESSDRLYAHEAKRSEAELAETRRRLNQMRELDKNRVMTRPFRQANYLIWKGVRGFKNLVFSEGFIYLKFKGRNGVWKLNRNAAWLLEDGRVIDKLIKHTSS